MQRIAPAPGLVLPRRSLLAAGGALLGSSLAAQAQEQPALPPARLTGRPQPQLDREPPEEMARRVGWAIVGLGKLALREITRAFGAARSSRLVSLVSGDRVKAEAVAAREGVEPSRIFSYLDFERIANDPAIQVVYIILPNSLHAEFAERAFKAGKHVFCEKPMAPTVEDCERMIRAGRAAGRKLMIANRARFEPHNVEAIRRARAGEAGRIRFGTSDHGRHLDPRDPADQWRMSKALAGGGSLYDIGIYSLQAARYMTGEEPVEVFGRIDSPAGDLRFSEVEDFCAFQLRFPSGAMADLSSSYSTASVKRIQAFGDKASLIIDPGTEYEGNRLTIVSEKGREEAKVQETNQFAAEMDHFSRCVRDGGEPLAPGEEGLRDVRIMQAIYRSASEGRPLALEATGSIR
jgi:predicted dehydrogenase